MMMKLSKIIAACAFGFSAIFASAANASSTFTVNAYDLNTGISSLNNASVLNALAGPADYTGQYATLDFSDGTSGTNGFFTPNNPFPGNLTTTFVVEASGLFTVAADDDYTFRVRHDDGTRIGINGTSLIDFAGLTAPRTSLASIFLTAGTHSFDSLFFENHGQAVFEVSIAQGTLQTASSFTLLTAAVPEPATWLMMILGFAITGAALKRRAKAFAA